MSNDDFRRELNSVFDDVSGSPSSNLPDRVRSAVAHPPEARGPYWLAAVAACVIAVLIVGVLYVAGPLKPPSTAGGVVVSPSPSPVSQPTAEPTPSASLPAFVCIAGHLDSTTPPSTPTTAFVSDLRTGTHNGYDRLTITFGNVMPELGAEFKPQSGATFTLSPSGMETTLKGQNGILITIRGADLHTSYHGSIDIATGYRGLVEVKRIQDFEGVVQLGLAVNGAACYRAFFLSNPDRLVIDVQTL